MSGGLAVCVWIHCSCSEPEASTNQGHREPPVSLYWERGNKVVTAKHRPGSVLETERLKERSRVSLQFASVELADTGEKMIKIREV